MRAVRRLLCTALALFGASLALPAPASNAQITSARIIVPFSPEGGTDIFARLVAAHLGRHLPGKPDVVVENLPGAGGSLGANAFVERARKGEVVLLAASGHLNLRAVLGLRGLQMKLAELEPVLASPMGHVTVIPTQMGVGAPHEIGKFKGRLTKGINDPVGQLESLVALDMLGLDYSPVSGFGGRGETLAAFERGELSINTQATPVYLSRLEPLVRVRRVMPLYAIGFIDERGQSIRDPAVPDLITAPELYMRLHGRPPSGASWEAFKVVVPLVQDARATLWMYNALASKTRADIQAGLNAMLHDASFHLAAREALGQYPVSHGHELRRIRSSMDSVSPEVLKYLRDMLKSRYGVEFQS